ncbi:MAG: tRNA (adenosine(37)-N6)-dimethylallyltransferase MiaA [Lentisphaerota bacterium]
MKSEAIIVLMGPTSSGKSELAFELAKIIPSEIISADSMQLYRAMDIGTAKPSLEERKAVPHHLIDLFDISQRVEVFTYVKLAEEAIESIRSRNKIPIIVGGSGMYIKALLYGLDPLPSDTELSKSLYEKYENDTPNLIDELKKVDPVAAERLYEKPRKMIRALEVFMLTGKSIMAQNMQWSAEKLKYLALVYKIKRERANLYARIAQRTDKMLASGWVEETERLLENGLSSTPTARQAIGYPLIGKYLEGIISYEEMRMRIVSSTKKYARRQETWFNNQHPEAQEVFLPDEKNKFIESLLSAIA